MKSALAKALKDLDGLGSKAIQVRILGMKDGGEEYGEEPHDEEGSGMHPVAETVEKAVAEKLGEPRHEEAADEEMVDPDLLEKLRELLAK